MNIAVYNDKRGDDDVVGEWKMLKSVPGKRDRREVVVDDQMRPRVRGSS